jgi:hypothetical protein
LKYENQIANIEKQKETRDMLGRFSKRAANFTHKKVNANSKYENEYNLKHIIIARLIPRERATLKVQHWYALWYSNPKTRLFGSLAIFGEIHITVCWY